MKFSTKITKWYKANKRNLPWRVTGNPYKIWLSEILLQQTRISQGKDYYLKFERQYPDIQSLARATEEEVLKLWQGLGYYSRGRNLHKTARIVVDQFDGKFPENHKDIISLPGIGEYTAAAISSISFHQPFPVIDGNVIRVLSRIFGILEKTTSGKGKKEITEMANKLIDKKNPGTYNQAVMEFGALYCKPQNPNCPNCIFRNDCFAFNNNRVNELPVKAKAIKQKKRYFHYLVIKLKQNNRTYTFLNKRTEKDIWQNLYDFPCYETSQKVSKATVIKNLKYEFLNDLEINIDSSKEYKHVLTHQLIFATFHIVILNQKFINRELLQHLEKKFNQIPIKNFTDYPIPRLIEKVINETQILSKF
jgi:A/G-specific adenine glycosylase